jgi:3-phosphoshikimate 1-carboxyvinyltransferase
MKLRCERSTLRGAVEIPGSKSHTIRAVAIACLAAGESRIRRPLESADARSALKAFTQLGAQVRETTNEWRITGTGGDLRAPAQPMDVGNSGTTMNVTLGACSLLRNGQAVLTGDPQIQRRSSAALMNALNELGAHIRDLKGTGCAPFEVRGTLRGGETSIEATSSQYLTSLLMATPLAAGDSHLRVPLLNERPYVGMTLDWLARQGIRVQVADDWSDFRVPGGQFYRPVDRRIPADFSSATFFLAAGALPGNAVECRGLDYTDTQGDKAIVEYLRQMGAEIEVEADAIRVRAKDLRGCELDINATPDALPMLAALACFARGETRLVNVPQARAKETDRIAVMREELSKMGGDVEELPDGLIIRESRLRGAVVHSHDDHRVVMALAVAATQAEGATVIEHAEAMSVTYPGFADSLRALGGYAEPIQETAAGVRA